MTKQFVCIPDTTWRIDGSVKDPRRNRLLSPIGYEGIISKLVRNTEDCDRKWETLTDGIGLSKKESHKYRRAIFTISTKRKIVDLFHNSCCGYRAQFYESAALGERANIYAVEQIAPFIENKLSLAGVNDFWFHSLSSPETKIWIYQGRDWIRGPGGGRLKYRKLFVERWLAHIDGDNKALARKARLARLLPDCEYRIQIKGGYLEKSDNSPLPIKNIPKTAVQRAGHLHRTGFT